MCLWLENIQSKLWPCRKTSISTAVTLKTSRWCALYYFSKSKQLLSFESLIHSEAVSIFFLLSTKKLVIKKLLGLGLDIHTSTRTILWFGAEPSFPLTEDRLTFWTFFKKNLATQGKLLMGYGSDDLYLVWRLCGNTKTIKSSKLQKRWVKFVSLSEEQCCIFA